MDYRCRVSCAWARDFTPTIDRDDFSNRLGLAAKEIASQCSTRTLSPNYLRDIFPSLSRDTQETLIEYRIRHPEAFCPRDHGETKPLILVHDMYKNRNNNC